jgi:osmotically-inducible protein OsmY
MRDLHKIAVKQLLIPSLFLPLLLSGCASIIDATSDHPIEEYEGTRTLGSAVEDESIELKVAVNLRKASDTLKDANVDIVSFNGSVLLVGEVPDEQAKRLAGETASKIRQVKKVYNELRVAGATSWLSRSNDLWITTKVSTQMTMDPDFPSSRVKVVTENGVVYLLGLVNETEAAHAIDLVQQIYGVERIVKLFEYI